MIEITGETKINLPIEACWEKLRDYSLAHNYVPDVLDTKITTEQKEGVGTARKVFMKNAPDGLDETIVEWMEGTGFRLRLHKGDGRAIPIFQDIHFEYRIEDAGNNETWFRPRMFLKPRFGFNILSRTVIKKKMTQTLAVIGQSMKEFYESGEPTSDARVAEIRKMF